VFSKMAIVSTLSKTLKLLTMFTQSVRLPKLADIIYTFFLVDHCLFRHSLLGRLLTLRYLCTLFARVFILLFFVTYNIM